MRTVYACSLDFPALTPNNTFDEIWDAVQAWVKEWYRKNGITDTLNIDWQSHDSQETQPHPSHSVALHPIGISSEAIPRLRQLTWRYPDSYDSTLKWTAEINLFKGRGSVYFNLLLGILGSDFEIIPARYTLGNPRIVRDLAGRGDAHIDGIKICSRPKTYNADQTGERVHSRKNGKSFVGAAV